MAELHVVGSQTQQTLTVHYRNDPKGKWMPLFTVTPLEACGLVRMLEDWVHALRKTGLYVDATMHEKILEHKTGREI